MADSFVDYVKRLGLLLGLSLLLFIFLVVMTFLI